MSKIKTHSTGSKRTVPFYKLPPPVPLPPLPPPDPTRYFSTEKYIALSKDEKFKFDDYDVNDETLKKVVLNEIGKCPDIWSSRSQAAIMEHYPIVATETYRRTGLLLSIKSLKQIYKCGKDNLRNRLRVAIVSKRLTPAQVEAYMWRWEFYGFIRYYRDYTQRWEADLLKDLDVVLGLEARRASKNMEKVDSGELMEPMEPMDSTMDEMCVEEEPYEETGSNWSDPAPEPSQSKSQSPEAKYPQAYLLPEADEVYNPDDFYQEEHESASNAMYRIAFSQQYGGGGSPAVQKPVTFSAQPAPAPVREAPSPVVENVSSSSFTPKPPAMINNFGEEMNQITYQAIRIAREQPERLKLLRKALFDVVLAFDQKEYADVGDLYRDLAQKNS
ncbi:Protein lin-8 [Caenorhabditis elegans]|uniref:Protein lin-8 n=1 Tax=Caenorhabditis elegans TaxID=6239 RepID=LIN8_CAEEL|nr:Protein lin-8 [Caenorhabditis elegans]G5EDW7.1 RecName: Full=Protein lin-8; AltName: Full=Abnormal cell lineage protein 8 [Caenorhabditis elegans]AAZ77787.1 synthetic multivulva protein LIN-8 [Caenorhabditis elegans]CCD61967.1 Protein lin-8 [Caenorhabditis elegans]|eukprot:NP_494436.1 Protein lin-8 [Caenorhabditis elegans]